MSSPQAIVIFDIDGVVRDVGGSYRRALADTVEQFTEGYYRPTPEAIDDLKGEGIWNNDWEASQELVYRYFESQGQPRKFVPIDYQALVSFFESKYRGTDPHHWNGYITQEPLLMTQAYLDMLSQHQILWGFFSGATRESAEYILKQRLGLASVVLVAMEDAPGKPDPTGLFATIQELSSRQSLPVFYAGDTVADMQTIVHAQTQQPERRWFPIGILPPHISNSSPQRVEAYSQKLISAGATMVLDQIEELSPQLIENMLATSK